MKEQRLSDIACGNIDASEDEKERLSSYFRKSVAEVFRPLTESDLYEFGFESV